MIKKILPHYKICEIKIIYFINIFIALFIVLSPEISFSQGAEKPNIIMIIFDDLNDYTGSLEGHPQLSTPNIDALANQGVNFLNAHTSAPGCGPSRTSMMSGKDCIYTKVVNNAETLAQFRTNFTAENENEEVYTFAEILKDSGNYYTYAINKVFHSKNENDFDNTGTPACEKAQSWNSQSVFDEDPDFLMETLTYTEFPGYGWGIIPDSLESQLLDYRSTDTAIRFIQEYANGSIDICSKEAFFMALGYQRPHTPRLLPEKYFLPYYLDDIADAPYSPPINTSQLDDSLNGVVMPPQPEVIYGDYYEFSSASISKQFADFGSVIPIFTSYLNTFAELPILDESLTSAQNLELHTQYQAANYVMAYLAAAEFLDTQVGRLLDSLQNYPEIYNNTIIIITSDHGYSLGEKKHYTKWALWETDLRVPLIIAGPGIAEGFNSDQSVSLLDVFPTVIELGGVDPNSISGGDYLDGRSLVPILETPSIERNRPSVATTSRFSNQASCFNQYSVRSRDFHMIRYQYNNSGGVPITDCDTTISIYDYELYELGRDRTVDPNEWENLNDNPNYEKMLDYLETFIPGGYNYLKDLPTVKLNTIGAVPCLLANNAKLKMKASLLDSDGTPLSSAESSIYLFKWTNNATPEVKTGTAYTFKMATVPSSFFTTNDSLFIYLEVIDPVSGNIVSFEQRVFYINPTNAPSSTFDAVLNGRELSIEDQTINGSYTSVSWTFGDGGISELAQPLIHTYEGEGSFILTQSVKYGNGCQINTNKELYIFEDLYTFCFGDSIELSDGTIITSPGMYYSTYTSVDGEDSVMISQVNLFAVDSLIESYTVCEGNSAILPDGSEVDLSGIYETLLPSADGCATLVITTINVTPAPEISNTMTLCAGGSITLPGGAVVSIPGVYSFSITMPSGCIRNYTINVVPCKLADTLDHQITVYPNPASNQLNIHSTSASIQLIQMYSADGKLVFTTQGLEEQNQLKVDLSNFSGGTYFVRVLTDDSSFTTQVIISK